MPQADHQDIPGASNPPECTWPLLLVDYPEAIIRVASLRANGEHHLIFAWVELYPFDMTAPEGWTAGEQPWPVPGKRGWSCSYSATKVPTADALRWYANAAGGKVNVALTAKIPVLGRVGEFAPEPAFGRFAVGVHAPFLYGWHDGPRLHQLVPLKKPSRAVCDLAKSEPARRWLNDNLGFNPFSFDEWLGAVAMVASDPLCCAVHTYLSPAEFDDRETLLVQVVPRRSATRIADLSTAMLHLGEQRAGAWTVVESLTGSDPERRLFTFPQQLGNVGHALVYEMRGLIRLVEPLPWMRQVNLTMAVGVGRAAIEAPAGGRRKPAQSYEVALRASEQTSIVGQPIDDRARAHLSYLSSRRQKRENLARVQQYLFGAHQGSLLEIFSLAGATSMVFLNIQRARRLVSRSRSFVQGHFRCLKDYGREPLTLFQWLTRLCRSVHEA